MKKPKKSPKRKPDAADRIANSVGLQPMIHQVEWVRKKLARDIRRAMRKIAREAWDDAVYYARGTRVEKRDELRRKWWGANGRGRNP